MFRELLNRLPRGHQQMALNHQRRRRADHDSKRRLLLEALEDRRLLAFTSLLTGTEVTFTGDASDDTLTLSTDGSGYLEWNGSSLLDPGAQQILVANVTKLTVNANAGNDVINLSGLDLLLADVAIDGQGSVTGDLGCFKQLGIDLLKSIQE